MKVLMSSVRDSIETITTSKYDKDYDEYKIETLACFLDHILFLYESGDLIIDVDLNDELKMLNHFSNNGSSDKIKDYAKYIVDCVRSHDLEKIVNREYKINNILK